MTAPETIPDCALRSEVTLTHLHKSMAEILDMALRAPVIITKHGRPHIAVVDARYFERLEEIAAGSLLTTLDRKHISTAEMSDELAAKIASQIPREKGSRWN